MEKFWKWVRNQTPDPDDPNTQVEERTLFLNGTIAEESWFDDDVTPALFKSELESGKGNITVWINSPGGDCFAAAQIYNMLTAYDGTVTVKIDGLAASAASVIAMAGDKVLVSPVSMIMIHNPATVAMGDADEMQKAIEMLDSVKNSIINAYVSKTGLSRNKLSKLMDEETWMDANKAVELGFADDVITRSVLSKEEPDKEDEGKEKQGGKEKDAEKGTKAMLFQRRKVAAAINHKLEAYCKELEKPKDRGKDNGPENETANGPAKKTDERSIEALDARLDLMKKFI